jgi:hypothetical protein
MLGALILTCLVIPQTSSKMMRKLGFSLRDPKVEFHGKRKSFPGSATGRFIKP